jgi:hypothetical protein
MPGLPPMPPLATDAVAGAHQTPRPAFDHPLQGLCAAARLDREQRPRGIARPLQPGQRAVRIPGGLVNRVNLHWAGLWAIAASCGLRAAVAGVGCTDRGVPGRTKGTLCGERSRHALSGGQEIQPVVVSSSVRGSFPSIIQADILGGVMLLALLLVKKHS